VYKLDGQLLLLLDVERIVTLGPQATQRNDDGTAAA
jgi:hypothetical protein